MALSGRPICFLSPAAALLIMIRYSCRVLPFFIASMESLSPADGHRAGGDVTQLLVASRNGHGAAQDRLFERIYTELRQHAHWQRRRWEGDPTLNTTALVNEAYLKLVRKDDHSWENRSHFFAVAARAMRQILINYVRAKHAQKRGGDVAKFSLDQLREALGRELAVSEERAEVLLALDEALQHFEREYPRASQVVECRFFGGMSIEETATALGVSTATVSRDWNLAKAWLYRGLRDMMP
jgi:RNA polymerase sigma factor (TIGR02999 family)